MGAGSKNNEAIEAIAKAHPLPMEPEALAGCLLDLGRLFLATQRDVEKLEWARFSMPLRPGPTNYPGAFLSNPAVLPSTERRIGDSLSEGRILGSLTAGFLFSYPHYQEGSLGPAALLCAAGPRLLGAPASPQNYARALLLLISEGKASSSPAKTADLQLAANGKCADSINSWFFNLEFDGSQLAALFGTPMTTSRALAGLELAISPEANPERLYTPQTLEQLRALAALTKASLEAAEIAKGMERPPSGGSKPRAGL